MPRLRAIFFDVDNTLCATAEFAMKARRNAVRAMIAAGLDAPEEMVWSELLEVINEFSSNYEHHYDKLLVRLPAACSEHKNRALLVAAGVAAYHDTKFRELSPYPGVRDLLSDLRDLGLRLGVITHGLTIKQAEKLVRLGLVDLFDPESIFISDQIGIAKPNPKLYQTALRTHDLAAAETMYVGDSLQNDILPPHSLGMVTVLARVLARPAEPVPDGSPGPDHVITSFDELRALLREHYDLALG